MIPADKFLTSEDMARIYRCTTSRVFVARWSRDRLQPPELRLIPDPVNARRGHGVVLLWSPSDVQACLNGTYKHGKRAAFR